MASGPSLRSLASPTPQQDEDLIVRYLRQGILFIACPGLVSDVLRQDHVICSPHIMTDGTWAWPQDLGYYVETYHARLPDEVIAHMRENDWRVPDEMSLAMSELEF